MSTRRKLTVGVAPALLLAAIVLPIVVYWDELPDSMATHWSLSGTPNGHMPPTLLLVVLGGIFLAVWVAVGRASRRQPADLPSFGAGLLGIGGLLAAVMWTTVNANRGVGEWTEAGEFTGIHLLVVMAVSLALGAIGWVLAGGSEMAASRTRGEAPMLDLQPGETGVWSGRGRGWVLVVIGIALIGFGVAIWSVTGVVLVVLALIVLTFAEVRTTASQRGVFVSLGWLGVPSWSVPLSDIEAAEVEQVAPMSYGGWGYRLRPGVRAIVVQGGDSLRLVRSNRDDLVLTVDDAETGAALINSLLARM